MVLQRLMDNVGQSDTRGIYRDKDTLAMALPSVVDLSLYTMLYQSVNEAARENIRYLLLDFSDTTKLCDSGIAALMCLQKLARDMHLRLLLLDMPMAMQDQLDSILPDAFWIDIPPKDISDSAEELQDIIARLH